MTCGQEEVEWGWGCAGKGRAGGLVVKELVRYKGAARLLGIRLLGGGEVLVVMARGFMDDAGMQN